MPAFHESNATRLIIADCHFSHKEASVDPYDSEQLWDVGDRRSIWSNELCSAFKPSRSGGSSSATITAGGQRRHLDKSFGKDVGRWRSTFRNVISLSSVRYFKAGVACLTWSGLCWSPSGVVLPEFADGLDHSGNQT